MSFFLKERACPKGWAVHSFGNGVSEISLKSAAGWSSGAMVSRYTSALSGVLALAGFQGSWVHFGRLKKNLIPSETIG
jgi:hypothetical protein